MFLETGNPNQGKGGHRQNLSEIVDGLRPSHSKAAKSRTIDFHAPGKFPHVTLQCIRRHDRELTLTCRLPRIAISSE
jgi:hypothetical protein